MKRPERALALMLALTCLSGRQALSQGCGCSATIQCWDGHTIECAYSGSGECQTYCSSNSSACGSVNCVYSGYGTMSSETYECASC